jgi:hypothetical protein
LQNSCINNGTCVRVPGGKTCACPVNFKGIQCEQCANGYGGNNCEIDFCVTNPCLYNSTCVGLPGGRMCLCLSNFQGDQCDQCKGNIGGEYCDTDFCQQDLSYCSTGGYCLNLRTEYTCQCGDDTQKRECEF